MKKKISVVKNLNIECIASSMGCRTYNAYDINFDFKEIINRCINGDIVD